MTNYNILEIAYFSHGISWAYKVRQKMNDSQKKKYTKLGLVDKERTISRKISLIKSLVNNTNLEMREINKNLRKEKDEVNLCLKEGKAFFFEEIYRIYRVIAYFESTLIQMVAVVEQLIAYISSYYRDILSKKIALSDILKMLSRDGIDTEWKRELYFIRRIVTHSHTGWPSFKKMDTSFQLIFNFPKSIKRMKDYKKYPYDSLETEKLNEILNKFQGFYRDVTEWFVNRV